MTEQEQKLWCDVYARVLACELGREAAKPRAEETAHKAANEAVLRFRGEVRRSGYAALGHEDDDYYPPPLGSECRG